MSDDELKEYLDSLYRDRDDLNSQIDKYERMLMKNFVEESRERQGIDVAEEIAKILQEELKEATSKYCKYDVCWSGRCNENVVEGSEYCQEHLEKKCYKKGCEEQAEGECHGYSGSMVCGAPMCKNHKHKH